MDDSNKLLESVLETASDYGRTSYELVKLKAIEKTTDIVSSLVPYSVVAILIASFSLFLNLGLALWLGALAGKIFYGFFIVAGFYIIAGFAVHLFLQNRIKRYVGDYLIKQILK